MRHIIVSSGEKDIVWLRHHEKLLTKGLIDNCIKPVNIDLSEIDTFDWKENDVTYVIDYDDLDEFRKVPDYVTKVCHRHGACVWNFFLPDGEIRIENRVFNEVDIVTVNTEYQKNLLKRYRNLDDIKKVVVTGFPVNDEVYEVKRVKKKEKVIVAQQFSFDSRVPETMDILSKYRNSAYLTTTSREQAYERFGKDTIRLWEKKVRIVFNATQQEFWKEASESKVFLVTRYSHTLNLSVVEADILGCTVVAPKGLYDEVLREYLSYNRVVHCYKINTALGSETKYPKYVFLSPKNVVKKLLNGIKRRR